MEYYLSRDHSGSALWSRCKIHLISTFSFLGNTLSSCYYHLSLLCCFQQRLSYTERSSSQALYFEYWRCFVFSWKVRCSARYLFIFCSAKRDFIVHNDELPLLQVTRDWLQSKKNRAAEGKNTREACKKETRETLLTVVFKASARM